MTVRSQSCGAGARSDYFKRADCGTVGTEQITPPLPFATVCIPMHQSCRLQVPLGEQANVGLGLPR